MRARAIVDTWALRRSTTEALRRLAKFLGLTPPERIPHYKLVRLVARELERLNTDSSSRARPHPPPRACEPHRPVVRRVS